jgi:hypothetical protein
MYPNVSDFAQFLLESKLISEIPDPIPDSWTMLIEAAITAFEDETGWSPFLASGDEETRTFRTNTHRLQLVPGAVSVTEVKVRNTVLDESLYVLTPFQPPYRAIEFASKPYDFVHVTGIFGYSEELPEDVRLALLQHAADALRDTQSGVSGAITRVKQDDVEYAYASNDSSSDDSLANWKKVVNSYKRILL